MDFFSKCSECGREYQGEVLANCPSKDCPSNEGIEEEQLEKRNKSNIERLVHFCNWGDPMNQILAINALTAVAEQLINNPKGAAELMGSGGLVHPDAWVRAAKEWKKQAPEYFSKG